MRWLVILVAACDPVPSTTFDVHVTAAGADLPGATVAITGASVEGAADVTDDAGLAQPVLFGEIDISQLLVTASKVGFDPAQVPASDGLIEIALVMP